MFTESGSLRDLLGDQPCRPLPATFPKRELHSLRWVGVFSKAGLFVKAPLPLVSSCPPPQLGAGTEVHGRVCQLQGADGQLRAVVTRLVG